MTPAQPVTSETLAETDPPRWLSMLCRVHIAASLIALATIVSTPITVYSALLYVGLMMLTGIGVFITLLSAWLTPNHWTYSNRTWVIALVCTIVTYLVDKLTTPPLIHMVHWVAIVAVALAYLLIARPQLRNTLTPSGCLQSRAFNITLALFLTTLIPAWGYSVLLVEPALKDDQLLKAILIAWVATAVLLPVAGIYLLVSFFSKQATTHIAIKLWQGLSLVLAVLVMLPISVLLIAHLAPVG